MAEAILIPNLSESNTEFVLVQLYKKVGEFVESGEAIAEVETDKANFEILSVQKGYLLCWTARPNETLKTNDLIAIVGEQNADYQAILKKYDKVAQIVAQDFAEVYRPQLGKGVFIAPTATVIGKVKLGDECSVWYGAVLRGDEEEIVVGSRTNIQDTCVIHADHHEPTIIGEGCIIGHGAIIHGASIGNHSLIGMRATVLNRAKIGNYCIIGAHALVTQDMEIPDYSVVMGAPARVVKRIPHDQIEVFKQGEAVYVQLAKDYLAGKFLPAK
jgi:carbonic anhydrase/acetyltransferase-like protein (isoleucine patch superfamily)